MYPHVIRLRGPWQIECIDTPNAPRSPMSIPGLWRDIGLADYCGPAKLLRQFHWTAKLEADEAVWLVVDQCVGAANVLVNGQLVGSTNSPWLEFRFDITHLLKPTNALTIEFAAHDSADEWFGTLAEGESGTTRHASVGGILGGVYLSIESRLMAVDWLEARGEWRDGRGTLNVRAGLDTSYCRGLHDRRLIPRLAVSLDGMILDEAELEIGRAGEWGVCLDLPSSQPWRPRGKGGAHRHTLQFEGRVGGITCIDRIIEVGFVDATSITSPAHERIGTIGAERAWLPFAGEDSAKPFEQWSLAQFDRIRCCGFSPPQSLLRLFDRAGMLVEVETPHLPDDSTWSLESREWNAWRAALRSHPCVVALRRFESSACSKVETT